MDPISAISSIIAILQGVAATKHVVNLIKEIPEIQNEYEDLGKELLLLEYMVNRASPIASNNPGVGIVQEKLERLLADLREIEKKCTREASDGKSSKAKRHRWLMEGNKIQKLREKACSAKHDLSIVLGINQRDLMDNIRQESSLHWKRVEKLMMKQEAFVRLTIMNRELGDSRRIEEVSDDDRDQETAKNPAANPVEANEVYHVQPREPTRTQLIRRVDSTLSKDVVPMTQTGCWENCQCQCHFHRPLPGTVTWMGSLVGSWRLRSTGIQAPRKATCIPGCKGRASGDLQIEYRPPSWLGNAWPTLSLRFALRPPTPIRSNDEVWFYMTRGPEEISTLVRSRFSYFPDQELGSGEGIAFFALERHAWDFLEILLQVLWKNLLPQRGLSRNVFFLANRILEGDILDDRGTYLCKLARSWADQGDEMRRTELHDAILWGDVEEAISRQPWAVDVLDHTGVAPIHLAAGVNSVAAIDALIKAKVDINQKDDFGRTALIYAASYARVEAVKRLIDAKCGLHIQAHDGSTALHAATGSGSAIVVQEILRAGASPHTRDKLGRTSLHKISMLYEEERSVEETMRLLLAAKADIEATDIYGITPILEAISGNNVAVLRCFFQNNASPYAVDRGLQNILHYAVGMANLEMLEFLNNQKLVGINTGLESEKGCTPWELAFELSLPRFGSWGAWRRPNLDEQHLIYQLLRGIEDRNLLNNIDTLRSVNQCVARMDKAAALEALAPLIKQMDDWNQDDILFDCMDIQQFIDEGNWDSATNLINDCVEGLEANVGVSPWYPESLPDPLLGDVVEIFGEEDPVTGSLWDTGSREELHSEGDERSLASTDDKATVEQQI